MFSRLNRRQKAKTLNQPGLVVESAEVFEGCDGGKASLPALILSMTIVWWGRRY